MPQARTNGRPHKQAHNKKPEQTNLVERQPPCDLQAEIGVLGSAILLFDTLDDVAQILTAEDFYDDAHQKLYRHLVAMHENGRRFDVTLLTDRLKAAGEYEAIGGAAYLSQIINAVPNAAHARYYADIVKGHSTARRLIHACTETLQEAYEATTGQEELVARAESAIARVSDETIRGGDTTSVTEAVQQSMAALNDRMQHGNSRLLRVGLDAFNQCMGLVPGGVTIVGGRPSQGKTAVAVTIASYVGRRDMVVYFASLEMTMLELCDRMLAQAARVAYNRMVDGTISQEDRLAIVDASEGLSRLPIFFDDRSSMTMSQISAAARRVKRRQRRLDLIIIDYLQLVEPEDRRDNRVEQIAKISRACKRMAREIEVPVIALAQVNRESVDGSDKRPQLHNLRGSGDLEQDADSVIFAHRPAFYIPDTQTPSGAPETAELILAKNRNGPTQPYETLYWKPWMTWANKASAARHPQEDYQAAACGERQQF